MAATYSNNSHYEYMQVVRHWSPLSEKYAGADCLLTAMDRGWQPQETVFYEDFWHAGSRVVRVYHFELHRNGDVMTMPVITNPYLRRVLSNLASHIHPLEERDAVLRRQPSDKRL